MAQTQSLPPRPNLEFLKKVCKERLKLLRATKPKTKLAEAQFAIAREYGFGSWRQLVARVQPTFEHDLDRIARMFQRFAEEEWHTSSPLYKRLSESIARDKQIMSLARGGREPIPHLFFAAVQYTLLQNPHSELARFYPSISPNFDASGDPFPAFKAFCLAHQARIVKLVNTQLVQTNEAARSGYLLPAFGFAWKLCGQRPLALVEIGASAGINLCFDQFAHQYEGDSHIYGNALSLLQFQHPIRGTVRPPLDPTSPPIAQRIGIDLRPIAASDSDGIAWLEALIWPEHHERRQRLRQALSIAASIPLKLIKGDASLLIGDILTDIPEDQSACVFQTHSLNQFSAEARTRFFAALDKFGANHKLIFISRHTNLTLDYYDRGVKQTFLLANCDAHGAWVEWRFRVTGDDGKNPKVSPDDIARRALREMDRAWAESCAIIERRFDTPGSASRWETGGLESPTLREREADEHILKNNVMGQYRIISIWQDVNVEQPRRSVRCIRLKPTRALEFLRPGETGPTEGLWRRIEWKPTNQGFSGKPARWDDLVEALTYLGSQAPPGEYRIITIRRMLFAQQLKDRIKIDKKHAGLTTLDRIEQSVMTPTPSSAHPATRARPRALQPRRRAPRHRA